MDRETAIRLYEAACADTAASPRCSSPTQLPDGSWLFVELDASGVGGPNAPYDAVVVRPNTEQFRLAGALGKVFRAYKEDLGLPRSTERFLGQGNAAYQSFDHGVAVWERLENRGFPILESLNPLRRQTCAVAFFDLRGFTDWSSKVPSAQVQRAVTAFEDSLHAGFPYPEPTHWKQVFLKGTGDGAMVVTQADWFKQAPDNQYMATLAPGHSVEFLSACEKTVDLSRGCFEAVGFPLAIGCGIAVGELDRLFLFGRLDYIGPAANEAAKLQQHAWNEVCVTNSFRDALSADGKKLAGERRLATKGWRLAPR